MKSKFIKYEKFINVFGLYNKFLQLFDKKIIKKRAYQSDLYKYSTGVMLIKHFFGYNGHIADVKKGNIGYGFLHYAYITALKPEKILCIGSQQGFIPAICAMACKDNQKGSVDFVDAGKATNDKNSWGGEAFWANHDPKKHFSAFDLNKYIKTYVMTSQHFAKKYKKKYEYIFIDADHSYQGVKNDFKLFWPRLTSGGIMGFHDITLKGLHNGSEYGVWKLWQELKKENQFSFINGDNAIGFIQKK